MRKIQLTETVLRDAVNNGLPPICCDHQYTYARKDSTTHSIICPL